MFRWFFWALFSLGLLAAFEGGWGSQESADTQPAQDQPIQIRLNYYDPPGAPPPPPDDKGG